MLIEELKTQYDKVKVSAIEADCKNALSISALNRGDFILKLYYLETTKRFKENKVYKNDTFETYIMRLFNLRYSTFNRERFAFIAHPVATAKWGAGLIDKIKNDCGAGKVTDVIQAIDAIPNIDRAGIDRIISSFRKPKVETKTTVEDTKHDLEQTNIKKQKQIAEYIQTVNELTDQRERMKDTIIRKEVENVELSAKINTLIAGVGNVDERISKLMTENAEHIGLNELAMSEIETLKAENVKNIQLIHALKAENFGYMQTIREQTATIERLKAENGSLRGQQLPAFMRHTTQHGQFRNQNAHV